MYIASSVVSSRNRGMPLPAASSTRRYDAHRHRWHEVQREHAECLRRHPRARPRSTADSSRAPSRTCDPEIIRAAWSTDILGRLGAQLRKPRGDPSTYALSHATMQIDGFVSHSWRHSGFRKFLALCYYYYNVPAICVALVATLMVAGLRLQLGPRCLLRRFRRSAQTTHRDSRALSCSPKPVP